MDPGVLIMKEVGNSSNEMSCRSANFSDKKEWEAPESNRTEAGLELTGSVPSTTFASSWASLRVTWFTHPYSTIADLALEDFGGLALALCFGQGGTIFCNEHCRAMWPGLPHL